MIEPKSFGEVVRTVSVTYPIPFLVAVSFAFALACLGGAMAVGNPLRWVLAGVGMLSAVTAVGIMVYSVLRRPDLLRSEQYNVVSRYIDLVGDNEANRMDLTALDRTMLAFLDEDVSKQAARRDRASRAGVHRDGDQ